MNTQDKIIADLMANNVYPTKIWMIHGCDNGNHEVTFVRHGEPFSITLKKLHTHPTLISELHPEDASRMGSYIARYLSGL